MLAGLITEGNCTWCAPGQYQTGVGMAVEVNCTWCAAGKYQTGAGLVLAWYLADTMISFWNTYTAVLI